MNIKIPQIFNKYFLLQLVILLFASNNLFSQNITAPVFKDGFPSFCANSLQNTFKFYFETSGFNAVNTFKLEMSDSSGDFTKSTIQDTGGFSDGNNNFMTLTVPSTFIGGDNYRFRVLNVTTNTLSPISISFNIYFIAFPNSFQINNNSSFVTICTSSGVNLNVTNIPSTILPSLKFKWFKRPSLIPISGETKSNLVALSPGVYYSKLDYGKCNEFDDTYKSQDISVNFYTIGGTFIITSSNGETVDTGVPTTLSTTNSSLVTYQWFNSNGLIAGAIDFKYTTDVIGTYYVEVSDGTCPTKSNVITLKKLVPGSLGSVIPNLISPNNDGENDTWKLEKQYTGLGTNIKILDSKGKIALETDSYLNNWPESTIEFDTINPIFYYIITTQSGEVKKGSITIVK